MNQITVYFTPCSPAPADGYNVQWRVAGTFGAYTDAGNFFSSPAVFEDFSNPDGTDYEGIITSDCGATGGTPKNWSTVVAGSGPILTLVGVCTGVYSSYILSGYTPGDVIVIRAHFSGLMQKISNNFVRANLVIQSTNGTTDSSASTCYSDTVGHIFDLTADTTVTTVNPTEAITLQAVVHNSSESASSVTLTILTVNGGALNTSFAACRGNSSTGGTC